MSWLDALLGRIRNAGTELALGSGLNFLAPLRAAQNSTTGFTDVSLVDSASIIGGQRAAITGEVTVAQNDNAATVTRSTDFSASPWTGAHKFNGAMAFGGLTSTSATGAISPALGASSTRLLLTGTGAITVGTVSGCADGRILFVEFSSTGTHTITHDSSSADAFSCPGDTNLVISGRGGFIAIGRLASTANWKIIATTN